MRVQTREEKQASNCPSENRNQYFWHLKLCALYKKKNKMKNRKLWEWEKMKQFNDASDTESMVNKQLFHDWFAIDHWASVNKKWEWEHVGGKWEDVPKKTVSRYIAVLNDIGCPIESQHLDQWSEKDAINSLQKQTPPLSLSCSCSKTIHSKTNCNITVGPRLPLTYSLLSVRCFFFV